MDRLILPAILLLILLAGTGCGSFRYLRQYRTADCGPALPYRAVRQELAKKHVYARYVRQKLVFWPELTHGCEGLYFAVLPSRRTHFDALVPCLITPQRIVVSTEVFLGKANRDTAGLAATLREACRSFAVPFTVAEIDSMQEIFRYGGQLYPKPGYHIHFR
jgi:hypothetical protein